MKKEDFFEVLGELDDEIVKGAKTSVRENTNSKVRKYGWIKWGAVAACLSLAVAGAAVFSQQNSLRPDDIGDIPAHGIAGGGAIGNTEDSMYSVAVYPAAESNENVASAEIISLTENEALSNSLAEHLPKQLPNGFHYGRGSLYNTVMKDGAQYNMLRVEYISGEIPKQQFAEDGGAIAPNTGAIGDCFIVCVMNYEPITDTNINSSNEEVTLSLLEENGAVCIRTEDCYVSVFTNTAESTAVLDAVRTIA